MKYFKVTGIVRSSDLERIEEGLKQASVRGITVTRAKGYGEYRNFFTADWMSSHARIEIFTTRAQEVANVIVNAAHTGSPGDGLVAIVPVEKVIRIRDRREFGAGEE